MTKKTVTSSPAKKPSDTMNKKEMEKSNNNFRDITPKITEVRKNNQSQFNSPLSVGSSNTRSSDSVSSIISYVAEMESSGSTTPTTTSSNQAVSPSNKTYEYCLLTPVAGYSNHHNHNHHYDSHYSSPQQPRTILQYYQLQQQSPCTRLRSIKYS